MYLCNHTKRSKLLLCNKYIRSRDINESFTQRHGTLPSLVTKLNSDATLVTMSRGIINQYLHVSIQVVVLNFHLIDHWIIYHIRISYVLQYCFNILDLINQKLKQVIFCDSIHLWLSYWCIICWSGFIQLCDT